jgi:hypothetical protein|tara:strand:+ start:2056 stop:2430 length:375 start_codon:yes stop_codon:yes gene_type:complete
MANEICPVCDKKIGFFRDEHHLGIVTHTDCTSTFLSNSEEYGGKPIEITEAQRIVIDDQLRAENNYQEEEQKIEDKSVYVKGFSMPFGEMVEFMVKWAIASIPAFIILFIIFGILFAVFGALFF